MDPIVGEFTVTSWSDPAKFHTNFPRSVNLDEGYEIALKSISHGPVTNLVHNTFTLYNDTTKKEIEITPRFYESPSDILLDVHKKIAEIAPVPLLYEQDGHIKMKLLDGYWIEINENMFLNRTFKYQLHDPLSQIEKRAKKRPRSPVSLAKRIGALKNLLNNLLSDMNQEPTLYKEQASTVMFLKTEVNDLGDLFVKHESHDVMPDDVIKEFSSTLANTSVDINKRLLGTYKNDHEEFFLQARHISNTLKSLTRRVELHTNKNRISDLEKGADTRQGDMVENTDRISSLEKRAKDTEYTIASLDQKIDQRFEGFSVAIERLIEGASNKPDDSKYSIDTSQMTSRNRKNLSVTEVSVPITPIVKTDLAFLYCSIVENSLVNNEETRVLTTIPITSSRGYNYFQFAQPIYRSISVRQFMDISLHILDVNGNYMNFNLYGDDVDKKNRKYPTILNLHIRQSIKGPPSGL